MSKYRIIKHEYPNKIMRTIKDCTPYVIIDDLTMSKVMELLNVAKCMAEKSYPHMTADYERAIKQVRERAECFTGSQNKPRTKKAY